MTELEEQLRSELRDEAGQITPDSIAGLRLPPSSRPLPGAQGRRGALHRRTWANPLAAAAAVAVAVAGTFAAVHAIPGGAAAAPKHRVRHTAGAGLPSWYAYTVGGYVWHHVSGGSNSGETTDRYLRIRATVTGKLLATISPPKPYNSIRLLTGDAAGRVFVLAVAHLWERGPTAPLATAERDEITPMKFLIVRITPAGQVRMSRVPFSSPPAPDQDPSIALSPDGTRLAVAYASAGGPAVVEVVTLATGQARRWVAAHPSWQPQVQSAGSWAANGQTLAVTQTALPGSRVPLSGYRPPRITRVRLLSTAAAGNRLSAAPVLALHGPAGLPAPRQPFLTPDGRLLISPVLSYSQQGTWLRRGTLTGELAVYSAATGSLLRTVGRWVWRFPSPPGRGGQPSQLLTWSGPSGSQLVVLQPSHDLNVLGVLSGGTFTADGGTLLPRQPAVHSQLQYALRHATLVAW